MSQLAQQKLDSLKQQFKEQFGEKLQGLYSDFKEIAAMRRPTTYQRSFLLFKKATIGELVFPEMERPAKRFEIDRAKYPDREYRLGYELKTSVFGHYDKKLGVAIGGVDFQEEEALHHELERLAKAVRHLSVENFANSDFNFECVFYSKKTVLAPLYKNSEKVFLEHQREDAILYSLASFPEYLKTWEDQLEPVLHRLLAKQELSLLNMTEQESRFLTACANLYILRTELEQTGILREIFSTYVELWNEKISERDAKKAEEARIEQEEKDRLGNKFQDLVAKTKEAAAKQNSL